MTSGKALLASWTFWFGALQVALALVGFVSGLMDQQASFTLLITGLGSIGFRFKTSEPIGSLV